MNVRYEYDIDCPSPRTWDNLGTFDRRGGDRLPDEGIMPHGAVRIPVYYYGELTWGYDNAEPHGYYYVSPEDVRKEFPGMDYNEAKSRALSIMRHELQAFRSWLAGECYGFIIEDDNGQHVAGCWGYVGYDAVKEAGQEALQWEAQRAAAIANLYD